MDAFIPSDFKDVPTPDFLEYLKTVHRNWKRDGRSNAVVYEWKDSGKRFAFEQGSITKVDPSLLK
jgi:hypothetical protein